MNGKNAVSNELERTWKESGITCFKTPPSYLTGQTEENHKSLSPVQDSNPGPSTCKASLKISYLTHSPFCTIIQSLTMPKEITCR